MATENYDRYIRIGVILTVVLIAATAWAWFSESDRIATASQVLDKRSLTRGRELYIENCTSCHGTRGEGAVGPALNNKALLKAASNEVLFAIIKAGRPNTMMPAWGQENGGPLTDEDIRQIVAFLRAWEPTAPEIKVEANPDAKRGATLFAGSCAICHGEEGKGGKAPALNDPARLKSLDDNWYRQTIANGRPAKGMPTWGTVLAPSQIEDLVALIAAWRRGERVAPEQTVADLLNSALFALSQGDTVDTLFYLRRAQVIAFGPALDRFNSIIALVEQEQLNQALADLGSLQRDWPIGDAQNGEKVYRDACAGCHGADGQGGVGRKLKPNEFIQKSTNAEVLHLLFTGREGTAMRSFKGRLTEVQLADVIAFLRTWQK